jgi:DNA (cytosine-5)-methyltransferase 1
MEPIKVLDLFSGIGGFALAERMLGTGFQTVAFCEIDDYCQQVLTKNFPNIPIFNDVRTLSIESLRQRGVNNIDAVIGGFPCQGNSTANTKGKGLEDPRSKLWFEMLRIIQETKPRYVVVENVPPTQNRRWDITARKGLEELDYTVCSLPISAAEVGANHLRKRLFLVAYSNSIRISKAKTFAILSRKSAYAIKSTWWEGSGELRAGNSGRVFNTPRYWACPVDDGLPVRLARLKALGNAVVPQCAQVPLQNILALEELINQEGL